MVECGCSVAPEYLCVLQFHAQGKTKSLSLDSRCLEGRPDRESLGHMVDLQVSLILEFFVVCRADIYVV